MKAEKDMSLEELVSSLAGKKRTFKYFSQEIRGTVAGYKRHPNEYNVLVERDDGEGWTMSDSQRRGTTLLVPEKSTRVYWWVRASDIQPEPAKAEKDMSAEEFARALAGQKRSFGYYSAWTIRGTVAGYNRSNILVERDDCNGWEMAPWREKECTLLIAKKTGQIYWWVEACTVLPEPEAAPACDVPECCPGSCSVEKEEAVRPDFAPGDVVYLKSGGPAMTVEEPADEDGEYLCVWMPHHMWAEAACYDHFKPAALTKTKPPIVR